MDDKDGKGLKLDKMRPFFSSFNIKYCGCKNHQKIMMVVELRDEICSNSSS